MKDDDLLSAQANIKYLERELLRRDTQRRTTLQTEGTRMTKVQLIELLMLLSAVESWSFADKHHMPDYLQDRLSDAVNLLMSEALK